MLTDTLPIYTVKHRNIEAVTMKSMTVSVDEHTHRQARIRAAELGMSLSALVRVLLHRLASEPLMNELPELEAETTEERRRRLIQEAVAEITANDGGLRMSENLTRDALSNRNALR